MQIRQRESEWIKEKAILEQKVELLEIKCQEADERELNLKKMHDTMMSALRPDDEDTDQRNEKVVKLSDHVSAPKNLRLQWGSIAKRLTNLKEISSVNLKCLRWKFKS